MGFLSSNSMTREHKVYIVSGPAGCGKSTLAISLSEMLQCPFIEGDSLHSPENVAKMAANIPLNDEDRYPWLRTFVPACRIAMDKAGRDVAFAACSALKRKYRDIIRETCQEDTEIIFLFPRLEQEALLARVRGRKDHYMKVTILLFLVCSLWQQLGNCAVANSINSFSILRLLISQESMVQSQLDIFEEPQEDEKDCVVLNVGTKTPSEVKDFAVSELQLKAFN